MSGAPFYRMDGNSGAVTHVYLSDATQGYGMYIEWMLEKKRRDGRVGTGRVNTTERREGADENAYSMRDARQQYLDAYAAHVGG